MRYFFRVEYDGACYSGWQIQNNNKSIQSFIEAAFKTVLSQPCKIIGAGRTDAGVHARMQGAHFDIDREINISSCQKSINGVLPEDISIFDLQKVPDSFHARYSAVLRCYSYYIASRKMPLWRNRAWTIKYRINWDRVESNIEHLAGTHDFSAFCASGHGAKSMKCTVKHVSLNMIDDGLYVFSIHANRFLYKMVRSIAGTLIDIGRGKINCRLDEILDKKNRKLVGETAPPYGLVLDKVIYREV